MKILKIKTYQNHSNTISFAGTLRNQKKFELFQRVFILCDDSMYECKIVGIELPPTSNPDYIYKIQLPEDLIEKREGEWKIQYGEVDRISRTCEQIFSTIEEAKESAMKNLDHHYELNKKKYRKLF